MQRIRKSMIAAIAASVLFTAGIGIAAQETKHAKPATASSKAAAMNADEMKWGPPPAGLPAGAQLAVLDGNPGAAGNFTIRLKMPDGYRIAPHSHPTEEQLTIISGTLMDGTGTKADESSMHAFRAGGFAKMPANMNHYVHAKGETVVQISGKGPFAIKYVNPSDDPRKKSTASKK